MEGKCRQCRKSALNPPPIRWIAGLPAGLGALRVFVSAIPLQPQVALCPGRARNIYRKELSDVVNDFGSGSFDLIASNAVIEEMACHGPRQKLFTTVAT
jgi:hypothetical protein